MHRLAPRQAATADGFGNLARLSTKRPDVAPCKGLVAAVVSEIEAARIENMAAVKERVETVYTVGDIYNRTYLSGIRFVKLVPLQPNASAECEAPGIKLMSLELVQNKNSQIACGNAQLPHQTDQKN